MEKIVMEITVVKTDNGSIRIQHGGGSYLVKDEPCNWGLLAMFEVEIKHEWMEGYKAALSKGNGWSDAEMKEFYKQGYSDCNSGLDCQPTANLQSLKAKTTT